MATIAKLLRGDIEGQIARGDLEGSRVSVETLAEHIEQDGGKLDADERAALFKVLRGKRQFQSLIRLADALEASGQADARTRQLKGQALIETGRLDDAAAHLERLLETLPVDTKEYREVRGNLGRAWKQRYVDAANATPSVRDPQALRMAIRHYGDVVMQGNLARDHWHVINFVACTARAERDGIDPGHALPSVAIARGLIATLEPLSADPATADIWLLASLGEAYVACGEYAKARAVYERYSQNSGVDAFECFSSMRQLVEVWQLKRDGAGGEIVSLLERRFGQLMETKGTTLSGADVVRLERMDTLMEGAAVPISGAVPTVPPLSYEAVIERNERLATSMRPTTHLKRIIRRVRSVARIVSRDYDAPIGAGFLVRGRDLHPTFGDTICLLTNNHVISRRLPGGNAPATVKLLFEDANDHLIEVRCADGDVLWESDVLVLDATLVRLSALPPGFEPQPICRPGDLPDDFAGLAKDLRFCHFIGPARDLNVMWTTEPNPILDLGWREAALKDHIFIHHGTETRDGSSGSPLFDIDWNVIGLHRAGAEVGKMLAALGGRVGSLSAKQAVSINSIRRQIEADLAGKSSPSPVRAPLSGAELLKLVESETVDEEMLEQYFVIDEEKSQPFNPVLKPRPAADGSVPQATAIGAAYGAVATSASVGFRARRNYGFKPKTDAGSGLTLVSDGDSWFQYPYPRVVDTIDHLQRTHAIYCHAVAGMELKDWAANANARIVKSAAMYRPDGVLLSGGGNDLLGFGGISNFVANYTAGATAESLVRPVLDDQIGVMVKLYAGVIGDIVKAYPKMKIFCHGYDWALPADPKGGWLFKPLSTQRGITDVAMQRAIVKILIDRFNERMMTLEAQFPGNLFFVDCRGAVGATRSSWLDELHPLSPGFGRVAARFNRRIAEAFAGDDRVIGIA